MKHIAHTILICLLAAAALAQTPVTNIPPPLYDTSSLNDAVRYLASDELAGRRTASPGGRLAAEYLAEQFREIGLQPLPGQADYFQEIPFVNIRPAARGYLVLNNDRFEIGQHWVLLKGSEQDRETVAVFAGHGWVDTATHYDDYKGLDVKGKVVLVLTGSPEDSQPFQAFRSTRQKREMAKARGAIGMIELFRLRMPWAFVNRYLSGERLEIGEAGSRQDDFFHAWLNEGTDKVKLELGQEMPVTVVTEGNRMEQRAAMNVLGWLPGSDPALKDAAILLSAHYDHVGVGRQGGAPYSPEDSIFNGARDNAIGTVALLAAARVLVTQLVKRPVIFAAFTGEEMGLLGSRYFAEHPVFPMEHIAYNLNNDGAGYNLTTHFSLIGWGRTNADTLFAQAAEETDLEISRNPAPDQNLFERSDNVAFAGLGIPAVTFSPGFIEMDPEMMKYYHQAADNPDSLDYAYLSRFWQAYTRAAQLLVNYPHPLRWTPGDPFDIR